MINLDVLKTIIENGLNQVPNSNFVFNLFSETGDYKAPERDRNSVKQYINGILSVSSSEVIPTNGINVSTLVTKIEFIVPVNDEYTDSAPILFTEVRNVIAAYFERTNVVNLNDDNTDYVVGMYAELPTTGEVNIRNGIGESINYTVTIYFSFVENGESSMDYEFYLNGTKIPYTSANISRINSSESGVYNTSTSQDINYIVKNIPVSSAFSVTMSIPSLSNNQAVNLIKNALFKGQIEPLTLKVKENETNYYEYDVLISNNSMALQGVQNAGLQVTFIEHKSLSE